MIEIAIDQLITSIVFLFIVQLIALFAGIKNSNKEGMLVYFVFGSMIGLFLFYVSLLIYPQVI